MVNTIRRLHTSKTRIIMKLVTLKMKINIEVAYMSMDLHTRNTCTNGTWK